MPEALAMSAPRLLRTRNTPQNHLGLPLPSGSIAVFGMRGAARLLEHESALRDTAVNEEVEIDMGASADVQVSAQHEKSRLDPAHAAMLPLLPGVAINSVKLDDIERLEVSNALAADIEFELRLELSAGSRLVRADRPVGTRNGRPLFHFTVPANQTLILRYQTQGFPDQILRTR